MELLTVAEQGRADAALAALLGLSRAAAARWLEEGRVQFAGRPVKKSERLAAGQTLMVEPETEPRPLAAAPQRIPLDVRYEDEDLIVVNKPVGMVVHPAAGHPDGTLVNALLYHCQNSLSGINGALRPGIVHRIDRDTSGLVIAAKNDRAHLSLAAQLRDHTMFRVYEAIAVGAFREDSGTVEAPVGRDPRDRKKMAVLPPDRGRRAVTHWRVLEKGNGFTHLLCRLETGRTHQIRVHMAYLGHPLLGDTVYGAKKPAPGLAGQCLHAGKLSFVHPSTGARVTVEAELPEWFQEALRRRGLTEAGADGGAEFLAVAPLDTPAEGCYTHLC